MKKLLFILIMASLAFVACAQYTTVDSDNYFEVQFSSGDTVFNGLGQFSHLTLYMQSSGDIRVYINGKSVTTYDPAMYGYTTGRQLANFLIPRYFRVTTERFNKVTNPDTLFTLYGTDTAYYRLLTYSSDSLLVVGPVTVW